ncbi:hypothetical protein M9458_023648, partial [Cirrhinus mrigala]
METPSPDGPADLEKVQSCSGRPVCLSRNLSQPAVLLPDQGNTWHGCAGTQLAVGPTEICVSPSEPSCTDTDPACGPLLAQLDLVPRTDGPCNSSFLLDSSEDGSTFSETGHPMAPASRPLETPCLVTGWDVEVLGDLPQEGGGHHHFSNRHAYAFKQNLFVEWYFAHLEDLWRCLIR